MSFLLTNSGPLFSSTHQGYPVRIKIVGYDGDRAYFAGFYGDDMNLIDSTFVLNGEIEYTLSDSLEPGVYRVFLQRPGKQGMFDSDPLYVDFIYNRQPVDMITEYGKFVEGMNVLSSEENRNYYIFLKLKAEYRNKLGALLSVLNIYDEYENFYTPAYNEFISLQKRYNDSLVYLSDRNPGWLSSSIISIYREPVFDPKKDQNIRDFMQGNFMKPVSFNDPRLIRTPHLTQKILNYLSFYRDPGSSQQVQEEKFMQAVDNIMAEVSYNEQLYDFVLNYLIEGFERFQMERVLVHIADNHLTGECKTEDEEIVRERLEAYKRMAEGKVVPDIALLDVFDETRRLTDYTDKKVLIVFWSSECPHCKNLMPRLASWYRDENEEGIEIYAVSIDKSRADWEEFVMLNRLDFVNVYDPEGWESKTSREYNLYATPTMFLVDSKRKIIAKPVTFRELKKLLASG